MELRRQFDEYLAHWWIEPAQSAFDAGVLFAKKHECTKRMCVDYRRMNDLTKKVVYPIPRIDECIDHMREATAFTKMDLWSGFHQIMVFPEHKERTAFQTRWGMFQYCVMPFGLCNAPATLQRTMNALLQEFHALCEVNVDDIVVFSKTLAEHAKHLALVLWKLQAK